MKYYFLVQIKIHDEAEYQKYLDRVDEVFEKFKGKYLAVDLQPALIEGTWNYTKSVIIEFPSRKAFQDWYYSNEYQEILKYRLKAATSDAILLEGM
jgi:uncharacterized protein (DUF1330 family)